MNGLTICVAYSGERTARFDREYYVQHHLPLVRKTWSPAGLEEIDAFFPADAGTGFIAIALCRFRDWTAYQTAIAQASTAEVMADVQRFTEIKPVRFQFAAIDSAVEGQNA